MIVIIVIICSKILEEKWMLIKLLNMDGLIVVEMKLI